MTDKEAIEILRGLTARIVPTVENTPTTNEAWEALSHLTKLAEENERKEAHIKTILQDNAALKAELDAAYYRYDKLQKLRTKDLAELARLQHIIECANTPLMADVLKERDELKVEVERSREENRPGLIYSLMKAWQDRAEKAEAAHIKDLEHIKVRDDSFGVLLDSNIRLEEELAALQHITKEA
jgi:hypothetical protein